MKIKGIILFLILLSFTVKAQMIDESKVPPAIVKHLNDKYKITGSVDWEKDKDLINAQFYVGDFKGYAYYKANGSYDSSYVEVDPIVLPDAVSQYIKENFKGLKIQYARKHEYADSKNNYFYITTPKEQNKKRYIPEFAIKPNGTLIYEVFPQDLASLRVKEAAQPKEQPKKKEPAKTVKKDPVQKEQVKNEDLQNKEAPKKETPKKEDPKAQKQDKPGAQKTDVSSSSIPKPVLDLFNNKYKQADDTKWSSDENNYIATFMMRGAKNYCIYTKDGQFVKQQTELDIKNLPPPLLKTVANYGDKKIVSAFNTLGADNQKYCELTLTDKKTKKNTIVYTNPAGQVIKEILPEDEQVELENEVDIGSVPDAVKASFNQKFPKASDLRWELKDEIYAASCFFKGEKLIAEYTSDGKWSRSVHNISEAKLPPPVQNLIISKYKKEKIVLVQFIETNTKEKYYYIETSVETKADKGKKVNKINKLQISPAGKLISQDAEIAP